MDFWRNEWEAVADTSEVADIKGVWQKPNRPKWEDVYAGCLGWSNITGHATLWVGKNRNVVGGHHYAHIIGELYFWELL